MLITDAQVHIWREESESRPWPDIGRERAHGASFSVEDLLARMTGAGVDAAVLVPPSWEGDRNDECIRAAREYPGTFAVMGRVPVTSAHGRQCLTRLLAQPWVCGVRTTFNKPESMSWISDGTAEWLWADAEAAGVAVYIYAPYSAGLIAPIAQRHPGLRIVVDHLGIPSRVYDEATNPYIDAVLALATFENVAVKASCLPTSVTEDYPYPALQRRVRRVVDAFGPRRTFWGSDLTRLRGSYSEFVRFFTEELSFLKTEDLAWIMGRGVREWLHWPQSADQSQQRVTPARTSTGQQQTAADKQERE